jgi:signal transduction histidine kinase
MKSYLQTFLRNFVIVLAMTTALALAIISMMHAATASIQAERFKVVGYEAAEYIGNRLTHAEHPTRSAAAFWLASEEVTPEEFEGYAAAVSADLPGFTSMRWIDARGQAGYQYPDGARVIALGDLRAYIEGAAADRAVISTPPIENAGRQLAMAVIAPIERDGVYLGTIVTDTLIKEIVEGTSAVFAREGVRGAVTVGDFRLLPSGEAMRFRQAANATGQGDEDCMTNSIDDPALVAPCHTFMFGGVQWGIAVVPDVERSGTILAVFDAVIILLALIFSGLIAGLYAERNMLNQAVRREKDFVSLVSHQLRGPLSELAWGCDDIAERTPPDSPVRQAMRTMRDTVKHANGIVADLLNVSRIERGDLRIDREEIPLLTVLEDIIGILRKRAAAKRITLVSDVDPGLLVFVDRVKTGEAIMNVIETAIEHGGHSGSLVEITAEREDGGQVVALTVRDHGAGIPAELRENIFEKMTIPVSQGKSSIGLGLYLSKLYVEALGGTITFESGTEGTTFLIRLPAKKLS